MTPMVSRSTWKQRLKPRSTRDDTDRSDISSNQNLTFGCGAASGLKSIPALFSCGSCTPWFIQMPFSASIARRTAAACGWYVPCWEFNHANTEFRNDHSVSPSVFSIAAKAQKALLTPPEHALPLAGRTSELGLVPGGSRKRAAGFFSPAVIYSSDSSDTRRRIRSS